MARLIVQFPGSANVKVGDVVRGETNRIIAVAPGEHVVELVGEATDPERHVVTVDASAGPHDVVRVGFQPVKRPIERFSPLYCLYNGFLFGQFLTLSFAQYGRERYGERRERMLEFLDEIAVPVAVPEEPLELGSDAHGTLLISVASKVAERSQVLADFVSLGALLTHYGGLAESDPATAREVLGAIDIVRERNGLPAIEPERFVIRDTGRGVDDVLSPSLAYLAKLAAALDVEEKTAFVIMPFKPPYASYFGTFYRPALEEAGFRAFRAWGGLSNEDYADLLLTLIEKSGMVWADVSELNYNVLYEIGAAHAFAKLSVLVVREDLATTVPANIGHDAVMQYSPTAEDWPRGTVLLMAALISALQFAAERGQRLRVGPEGVEAALEWVGAALKATLVPPEAEEAARNAREKYGAGDFAAAESLFDEAIRLGLDDEVTKLGRGTSRVALGKYAEAEDDLTGVLGAGTQADGPLPGDATEHRSVAAYFRGMAREHRHQYAGARDDYATAIALGYSGAEVFRRRAFVSIQLGETAAAASDVERASALAPEDPETHALRGDFLLADRHYEEAIGEYDASLAARPEPEVALARALALLLSGRLDDATVAYRAAAAEASADGARWALGELERRASGRPGMETCRVILSTRLTTASGPSAD